MSPVAAAFASPCNAFGDCAFVVAAGVVCVVCDVAGVVGAAVFALPHAARRRQSAGSIRRGFTISR